MTLKRLAKGIESKTGEDLIEYLKNVKNKIGMKGLKAVIEAWEKTTSSHKKKKL